MFNKMYYVTRSTISRTVTLIDHVNIHFDMLFLLIGNFISLLKNEEKYI